MGSGYQDFFLSFELIVLILLVLNGGQELEYLKWGPLWFNHIDNAWFCLKLCKTHLHVYKLSMYESKQKHLKRTNGCYWIALH